MSSGSGHRMRVLVHMLRNAVIAGLCGMAAQQGLMAARHGLGILPTFQPYHDLQNLVSGWLGTVLPGMTVTPVLSWVVPMISGALVWSSIFAWAYDVIPGRSPARKGVAVTLFAWFVTGLIIFPLIGHGVFATKAGAALWPALMMLVMLCAYCLTLSLVYGWLKRDQAPASARD